VPISRKNLFRRLLHLGEDIKEEGEEGKRSTDRPGVSCERSWADVPDLNLKKKESSKGQGRGIQAQAFETGFALKFAEREKGKEPKKRWTQKRTSGTADTWHSPQTF